MDQQRYESFVYGILDTFSRYSKQLHDVCEKYKSSSYHGGDNVQEQKPKRPAKKKVNDPLKDDPNAPKKPVMQGYLLYYTEVRGDKEKYPQNLTNQDITKMIAEAWNKLPKDKREHYEVKSRMNKQQYEKDLEEYFKKNPKMREVYNAAKGGGSSGGGAAAAKKPTQTPEKNVSQKPAPKAKPKGKVLASSSDEDDDDDVAEIKSPSPEKAKPNPRTKAKIRGDFGSDEDESDSSSDSDRPIKKLVKK